MYSPASALPPDAGELSSEESKTQQQTDEERAARLEKLGAVLAKSRKEAILARQSLGIDEQWTEDLEFYEGIDDANRAEMGARKSVKPTEGGSSPRIAKSDDIRSTVFVNITRPYCDAAAARISDMLMPTDDRAFSIGPTPVPDLGEIAKGNVGVEVRKAILDRLGPSANKEQADAALGSYIQTAQNDLDAAKAKADKAQKRIDDWLVQCQFHAEARKLIDDCARIGTGVLKGPVPVKRKSIKVLQENGSMKVVIEQKIDPASKRLDPLNLFPDGACGENIHNGSHIWERDYLTEKTLRDLKGLPGYLDSEIDACIEEGPQSATEISDALLPQGQDQEDIKGRYEVWYYTGTIDRKDMEALGCKCPEGDSVYAQVTMINKHVIKGVLNPLDTGDFPYDVMVWQRQAGKWTGTGVSRQIRTPQRMVNSATRAMMDNAGISSGPQIVFKLGVVRPADGVMQITPRKVWYIEANADAQDLNNLFRTYNIDSKQEELMGIVQFGLKLAEDVTGLPLLLQGQQGKAPDTLGGMQMLNNNSSTVLRRLAKLYDDCITEPHIRRYYVFLLQYGEDDDEKGDFQIDARGSSALVERDIQNQAIAQMGNLVLNPAFKIDPSKWIIEHLKSQRLDPKRFQYTDQEWQQVQQNMANQPSDPKIAVAQINADLKKWTEQFQAQLKNAEMHFESQQQERDRQKDIFIAEINNASKEAVSLDDLKARLADTTMKLRTQRDLSQQSDAIDLHKHSTPQALPPPTEPAGKAPTGQAFQR
jgi:hypothetical protein